MKQEIDWKLTREELPECSGYYLVCTDTGNVDVSPFSKKYNAFNVHDHASPVEAYRWEIKCDAWAKFENPFIASKGEHETK